MVRRNVFGSVLQCKTEFSGVDRSVLVASIFVVAILVDAVVV